MTDTLDDLQAERQRIIAALIDNDRAIQRTRYPARPGCFACDGRGMVARRGGIHACSCARRAPVKGDTR